MFMLFQILVELLVDLFHLDPVLTDSRILYNYLNEPLLAKSCSSTHGYGINNMESCPLIGGLLLNSLPGPLLQGDRPQKIKL
jgi:hypothetical protein